jgi:hypothetical protein
VNRAISRNPVFQAAGIDALALANSIGIYKSSYRPPQKPGKSQRRVTGYYVTTPGNKPFGRPISYCSCWPMLTYADIGRPIANWRRELAKREQRREILWERDRGVGWMTRECEAYGQCLPKGRLSLSKQDDGSNVVDLTSSNFPQRPLKCQNKKKRSAKAQSPALMLCCWWRFKVEPKLQCRYT